MHGHALFQHFDRLAGRVRALEFRLAQDVMQPLRVVAQAARLLFDG